MQHLRDIIQSATAWTNKNMPTNNLPHPSYHVSEPLFRRYRIKIERKIPNKQAQEYYKQYFFQNQKKRPRRKK